MLTRLHLAIPVLLAGYLRNSLADNFYLENTEYIMKGSVILNLKEHIYEAIGMQCRACVIQMWIYSLTCVAVEPLGRPGGGPVTLGT